jgi:hypothetical protein
MDSKKMYYIVFAILAALSIANFTAFSVTRVKLPETNITASTNILTMGFITVLITLSIAVFSTISNTELNKQFVWPVSRSVYAAGCFIYILYSAVVFISGISVMLLLELLPAAVLKLMFSDILFINVLTVENFITGFWVSLTYLVLVVSAVYCLGMYFYRNKIIVSIIYGTLLILTSIPVFRDIYAQVFQVILFEQSVILFSIKAWLAIAALHAAAYIPLKRMEVRV